MAPEFGAVFAPVMLFNFEQAALAPHQLAQQSFSWQKIVRINFAANFTTDFMTMFRIEFDRVRAGQFLLAVPKYFTERGIRFQNPAIELANPDPNRCPFKHRPEAQIALVIACRRKLGHDIHTDTTPRNFRSQVSGLG